MNRKIMTAISLVVMLAMILVAVSVERSLSASTRLPIHWNFRGQPDAFANSWTALLMPLLVAGPATLIFFVLPATEPRRKHLEQSRGLYFWMWASFLLLGLFLQLAVVSAAMNWAVHAASFILAGVGVMFVLTGNQLGKSRSMSRIGLRTRWTLASEDVWMRTHRLSGKLMVAGGLLIIFGALLQLPVKFVLAWLLAVVIIAIVLPMGFSYIVWRREEAGRAETGRNIP